MRLIVALPVIGYLFYSLTNIIPSCKAISDSSRIYPRNDETFLKFKQLLSLFETVHESHDQIAASLNRVYSSLKRYN